MICKLCKQNVEFEELFRELEENYLTEINHIFDREAIKEAAKVQPEILDERALKNFDSTCRVFLEQVDDKVKKLNDRAYKIREFFIKNNVCYCRERQKN